MITHHDEIENAFADRSTQPTRRTKANGAVAAHSSFDWLKEFELSDQEAEQISDPTWIETGMYAEGHVIAIVAKPNGGKTTICFHQACDIAATGKSVVYVHADTNPSDAKRMRSRAQRHRVRYLTPDMKVGRSMADVVRKLQKLAQSDADLAGQVWFFDTLKKMANVISKESLKATLALMRKLSARGMTCILLCHTNKYRNDSGEWQYEGTGDLESDCDELIYFEPRDNDDGSLTVSTRCTKRRAQIEPITWDILPDRTVTRRDEYVDVVAENQRQAQREQDQPTIEAITEVLTGGSKKQTEIIAYCHELKITEKRVRTVLKRYSSVLWRAEKLFEKNAWRYELNAITAHPRQTAELAGLK